MRTTSNYNLDGRVTEDQMFTRRRSFPEPVLHFRREFLSQGRIEARGMTDLQLRVFTTTRPAPVLSRFS
jgi:hypothetical protein